MDLPCGGCGYCIKADKNTGALTAAVDDTGPFISQELLDFNADSGLIRIVSTGDWVGGQDVKAGGDNAECQVCEEVHNGKCIRRFGGIYAYCRYFIDRKW